MRPALIRCLQLSALAVALSGCDQLGIETAAATAAKREAEGKAIGGACRHAGRALEDCYLLNKRADKGAVFAGWREMNDYMRENKITEVAPQQLAAGAAPRAAASDEESEDEPAAKPAKPAKAGGKAARGG
jgi:hypothetical protein